MRQLLFIALLLTACKKQVSTDRKEAKPATVIITVDSIAPLSDSTVVDEMPRQEGTPIVINRRLFIKQK